MTILLQLPRRPGYLLPSLTFLSNAWSATLHCKSRRNNSPFRHIKTNVHSFFTHTRLLLE
jgi:hypothetical protein